jgi:hypothetical protein
MAGPPIARASFWLAPLDARNYFDTGRTLDFRRNQFGLRRGASLVNQGFWMDSR